MAKRHLHVLMNEARVARGGRMFQTTHQLPQECHGLATKIYEVAGGPELLQTQKNRAIQIIQV